MDKSEGDEQIIVCKPIGGGEFRAEEFGSPIPATKEARALGCVCPEQPEWPRRLAFSSNCELHALKKTGNMQ